MIDKTKLPDHIAIILDGNGRYAKKKFMPRQVGHKKGADNLKEIVEYANEMGIKHLTVYAFSTENWNREEAEVTYLMELLNNYLDSFLRDFKDTNIIIDTIGDVSGLNQTLQDKISEVYETTKNNTGIYFTIAINYGSRDEMTRAIRKISQDVKECKLNAEDIDQSTISSYLDTHKIPDPDFLIRTSNEFRLSNFLLWQLSYSELYFTEKLWPEFTTEDFDKALLDFSKRERRFGGRKS